MTRRKEHAPCLCGDYDHKNGSCFDASAAPVIHLSQSYLDRVSAKGAILCSPDHKDAVAFQSKSVDDVVRAVNLHDDLVAAVKRAHAELDRREGGIFVPAGKTCYLCDVIVKAELKGGL